MISENNRSVNRLTNRRPWLIASKQVVSYKNHLCLGLIHSWYCLSVSKDKLISTNCQLLFLAIIHNRCI